MVNQITHDFEEKLKQVIAQIEAKSPIEIVPVIVKRASAYSAWSYVYGYIFAYLPARLIASSLPLWSLWTLLLDALIWFALGAAIAFVLRRLSILSLLIPLDLKHERSLQLSESLFLNEGVHETKDRLGVLIAVFEFEKSVVVLADKGFAPHVKSEYWSNLGKTLAQDFNRKRAGDEFFQALKEIEETVIPKFPHRGENTNEISDDLRKK